MSYCNLWFLLKYSTRFSWMIVPMMKTTGHLPHSSQMKFTTHMVSLVLVLYSLVDITASEPQSLHYNDIIMGAMASQINSLTIVYLTLHSDQRKHQSSTSLAFVRGIHRSPVNSPHKESVTRKMFPFDDLIMAKVKTHSELHWKCNF